MGSGKALILSRAALQGRACRRMAAAVRSTSIGTRVGPPVHPAAFLARGSRDLADRMWLDIEQPDSSATVDNSTAVQES